MLLDTHLNGIKTNLGTRAEGKRMSWEFTES